MRRGVVLLAPGARPRRWGGLKYKQDMRHVEEKRMGMAQQKLAKEQEVREKAKDVGPTPATAPMGAAPLAPPDEGQKQQRRELQKQLRERCRQRAQEEFQQSVVSLLQHRTPPLYPDSFRFFEDIHVDVLTPSTEPLAEASPPPPGFVVFLEQQLLERVALTFRKKALMVQAFTHPSFLAATHGDPRAQRASLLPLTYAGHALLHLHLRSYLMQVWPNRSLQEYQLFVDHWLASDTVCGLAESLRLPQLALTDAEHAHEDSFLTQKGTAGYRIHKPAVRIGCEVFEALVGAVYLDSDVVRATDFIQRVAVPYFTKHTPKSVFAAVRDCWATSLPRGSQPPIHEAPNNPQSTLSPP